MDKRKKISAAAVVIISLAMPFLLAGCGEDKIGDRYVSFASCLYQKGVKMYGTYWCPVCNDQKSKFGVLGAAKLNYVECDGRGEGGNPDLCLRKGIARYPTWEFADGTKLVGELPLEQLAEKTGCKLPETNVD